jgi:O-methyltransferase
MLSGEYALAKEAYRVALKGGVTASRVSRYGLAATPTVTTAHAFRILQEIDKFDDNTFVGAGLATWHKPPPFYYDHRFMQLAERHAKLLGQPNWHWNLNTVVWAVEEARSIEGDFVELGVFKGHTTLFTAEYLNFETWPKTWWLCDTFEGVPEDQLDPGWTKINRDLYENTFSHEEVVERFAAFPNIHVHKGRVPEALAEGCPEKIAFLHMDMNNATAEIAALDVLFDRLSPGGIIIFDDFGWSHSHKQNKAEKAWFAERGLRILALPTGQGLFRKLA